MAIQWGDWEDSGGNGMRVGLEITWGTTFHSDTHVDVDVDVYTQNRFSYSDSQTLTYGGGSISGTTNFTNNQGGTATLRATKSYTYNYGGSSYGSSPATKTFSASLSGAFNGVTPSVSKTSAVPLRPYAAPAAPTSVSASRISDALQQISWVNHSTAGEPWNNVFLQQSVSGGGFTTVTTGIAGSASSYSAGTVANTKYRFQVAADNTIATSSFVQTGDIWTSPGTPTINTTLTPVAGPTGQRIQWTNNVGYSEYQTVIVAYKDGVDQGAVGTVSTGVTQFDHTTANGVSAYTVANRWKYYIYARTTTGALIYSGASSWTDETPGSTTPPLASTGLAPNGTTVDPTIIQNLTWTFVPGQVGDTQTKYQVRHRLNGSSTWTTTSVTSSVSSTYALPASTYSSGQSVEWQVATYGADPVAGPFSASAVYQNTSATAKLPIYVDMYTGEWELPTSAYIARYALAATIVAATTPDALPPATSVQFLTSAESTSGGWPWGAVAGFLRTETFVSGGTKYATQRWEGMDGAKNSRVGSTATWGVWAWGTYTPTLTQSATVAKTVSLASYASDDRRSVTGRIYLAVTGAGTANNAVLFGLPVAAAFGSGAAGAGYIYDSSAGLFYAGTVDLLSSTTARFFVATTGNAAGGASGVFTAALASGDVVSAKFGYEGAA